MRRAGWMLVLGLPATGVAAELRTGEVVVIDASEVVRDDLYVAAPRVEVNGTIDGDLVVLAQQLTVGGAVTGDALIVASDTVTVDGDVVGSVRVAGADVWIDGQVAEDVVVAARTLAIPLKGRVARDVLVTARDVALMGVVGRSLVANAVDVRIDGAVAGDVTARARAIALGAPARVGGDLRWTGPEAPDIAPSAVIGGQLLADAVARPSAVERVAAVVVGGVRALVGLFVAGLLVSRVFPGFTRRAADALAGRPAASLASGIVAFVGVPLAAVLVAVVGSVVGGWWLAAVGIGVLGLAGLAGLVVTGRTLGAWLLARCGRPGANPLWALLLGLVILLVLRAIPGLGVVVLPVAALSGLGAVTLAGLSGTREALA